MNRLLLCSFVLLTLASCVCKTNCVKEPGSTVVDILLIDGSTVSRQFYSQNLMAPNPIAEDSIAAFKAVYANITDTVLVRLDINYLERADKCVNCKERDYYEKSGYHCNDYTRCGY